MLAITNKNELYLPIILRNFEINQTNRRMCKRLNNINNKDNELS